MKRAVVLSLLACCVTAAWLAPSGEAHGQATLEQLEQRIRARLKQGADQSEPTPVAKPQGAPAEGPATKPAEKPAEPVPMPAPIPPQEPGLPLAQPTAEPGYLGVMADDEDDRGRGVRILEVRDGSPAQQAGLRRQDLIMAVAEVRVRQMADLADMMRLFAVGETVAIEISRGGKAQTVDVKLGSRPAKPMTLPATANPGNTAPPVQPPQPIVPRQDVPPAPPPIPPEPVVPNVAPPAIAPPVPVATQTQVDQLLRRIEQLERRVAELERALGKAPKRP